MLENYKNILADNLFIYIDIGSRGGLSRDWEKVKDLIQVVFFEPDEEEAKRLKINSSSNELLIPKAVWSHSGKINFHSMRNPSYSSVLKPNKEELEGTYYYCRNFYHIENTEEIKVEPLEVVLKEYGINNFDFLKIDIQGAENYIFNSISNWNSIIGVHTEAYGSKLYQEGSDISEILKTIYERDLELYSLSVIADSPIVEINNENVFSKELLNARPKSGYKSRPMVYDLLLFKNKLKILNSNDPEKIRKMIFILCVYEYFDYALNLIIKSLDRDLFNKDDADVVIQSIKILHKASIGKFQSYKESLRSSSYNLRKR